MSSHFIVDDKGREVSISCKDSGLIRLLSGNGKADESALAQVKAFAKDATQDALVIEINSVSYEIRRVDEATAKKNYVENVVRVTQKTINSLTELEEVHVAYGELRLNERIDNIVTSLAVLMDWFLFSHN
jgi:hypothetical protein